MLDFMATKHSDSTWLLLSGAALLHVACPTTSLLHCSLVNFVIISFGWYFVRYDFSEVPHYAGNGSLNLHRNLAIRASASTWKYTLQDRCPLSRTEELRKVASLAA